MAKPCLFSLFFSLYACYFSTTIVVGKSLAFSPRLHRAQWSPGLTLTAPGACIQNLSKGDQHTFHSLKLLKAQTINALTGLPDKALTSQVFVLQLAMDKDTLDRHLITSTFVKDGLLRLNSTKVDNATQWIPLKPFKSQSV